MTLFPGAAVVGDDWDYPDVQRAAKETARKFDLRIHAEQNKCWTFSHITSSLNNRSGSWGQGGRPAVGSSVPEGDVTQSTFCCVVL